MFKYFKLSFYLRLCYLAFLFGVWDGVFIADFIISGNVDLFYPICATIGVFVALIVGLIMTTIKIYKSNTKEERAYWILVFLIMAFTPIFDIILIANGVLGSVIGTAVINSL